MIFYPITSEQPSASANLTLLMYFYLIFCLYSDVLSFVSSVHDMHQSMFFPSSTGSSEDEALESVVMSLWSPLLALTSRQANRGPQEHKGPSTATHWVSGRAAAARPSWPRGSKLSRLPGRSCRLVTVMSRPEVHIYAHGWWKPSGVAMAISQPCYTVTLGKHTIILHS